MKPLNSTGRRVLEFLGAGNNPAKVAMMVPCSKGNVTYWKNKLVSMGALRLIQHDVIDIYDLTPTGSKILTTSDKPLLPGPVVLEDHAVKFGIVELEKEDPSLVKVPIKWEKLGQPQNWEKVGFKLGRIRVVKTSRSIIIHPGPLQGFNVDELEILAGQIIERVRLYLENRYGLVLTEEGIPLHKPCWRIYTPEAEVWARAGSVSVPGVGRLDKSPPGRQAHREYDQKSLAVAAVMEPVLLEDLDRRVAELTKGQAQLVENLAKLTEQITNLVVVLQQQPQASTSAPQKPNPFSV